MRPIPALVVALLWSVQAQAHARLVSAEPAAHATVSAPKLIHLQFSEEIARRFSSLRLADMAGHPVALRAMSGDDAKVLEAAPTTALRTGPYTVTWTAVSTGDGHKTSGSYSFTVR